MATASGACATLATCRSPGSLRSSRSQRAAHTRPATSRASSGAWASAPLYVYLALAAVLEVEPGRLLGSDDAQKPITEAEMTLVRFIREVGLAPHVALARLAAR